MYIVLSLLLLCANGLIACEPPKNFTDEVSQKQTIKKRIEGDIFIVSNGLYAIGENNELAEKCAKMHILLKLEPKEGNRCAKIWTADRDAKDSLDSGVIKEQFARGLSANWHDHGHPTLGLAFPDVFPLSQLEDKKEGDIIEFDYPNKETNEVFRVVLTCAQLKHRYWRHGKFHEVLEQLKNDHNTEEWLIAGLHRAGGVIPGRY